MSIINYLYRYVRKWTLDLIPVKLSTWERKKKEREKLNHFDEKKERDKKKREKGGR